MTHKHTSKKNIITQGVERPRAPGISSTADLGHPRAVLQRAYDGAASLSTAEVNLLQRTVGNAAVQRILDGRAQSQSPAAPLPIRLSTGHVLQPKLTVGPVGDKCEQEADRVALHVVNTPGLIQRQGHLDTGMDKDEAVERYTKKTKARFTGGKNPMGSTKQWSTLDNASRKQKLLKYANAELNAAHSPKLKGMTEDPTAAQPTFDMNTWTMKVVGDFGRTDAPYLEWLAATVYHESRHSEQYFRMARKLAGDGQTAAQISTALLIPADIAAAAVKRPLKAQSKASKFFHSKEYNERQANKLQETSDWYESVYGTGRQHRTDTLLSPNMGDVTSATYQDYLNLPEELDAYSVEGKVRNKYQAI